MWLLVTIVWLYRELVDELHARNVAVYLVSGGFQQLIEPIADSLNIPKENIYANYIFFNEKGDHLMCINIIHDA